MRGKNIISNSPMAWVEIDIKALQYNFKAIKNYVGQDMKILAVVKADAYGHGIKKVAKILCDQGVDFLGVSDIREGILLRREGIKRPILMMENALTAHAQQLVEENITPVISSLELARKIDNIARMRRIKKPVHVKVDTGMCRLGVAFKDAVCFIQKMHMFKNLSIEGLMTHFPVADTSRIFTHRQIKDILSLSENLKNKGIFFDFIHAANSAGTISYDIKMFNLIRTGIMLYGIHPIPRLKKTLRLKPVMSVKSRVCFIKKVQKGQGISYGHCYIAKKQIKVATISIGYSDGYFRSLSNKAHVLIRGKRCPVIGMVTMDQVMVDVSCVKNVRIGDEVCILGKQKKSKITAEDLAKSSQTIPYEIVCALGSRLR